ncbi:hypothetical protein, partial [Streptomyces flavofungini]|uniref:hypothetical protein n=1 Tax=Streptomyces flavofungini TaxID=68200 RepID=UPI0034DF9792
MSNSRAVLTVLASAVLSIGAVTALASTADAAPRQHTSAAATAHASAQGSTGGSQDIPLSDGAIAHVSALKGGKWQAWVTQHG